LSVIGFNDEGAQAGCLCRRGLRPPHWEIGVSSGSCAHHL